jgi:Ca2+-binding EF-hand superfamily protein
MRNQLLAIFLLCLPGLGFAQSNEATAAMERLLQHHIRLPESVVELQATILEAASEFEVDGKFGLSIADYSLFGLMQRSSARNNELALFLRNDLDGDGAVTPFEIAPFARFLAAQKPLAERSDFEQSYIGKIMERDINGDGSVAVFEFNNSPAATSFRLVPRSSLLWMEVFSRFDADGNGMTEPEEVVSVFDATLLRIDANSDAYIDQDEISAFHSRIDRDGQFQPEPSLLPLIEEYLRTISPQ